MIVVYDEENDHFESHDEATPLFSKPSKPYREYESNMKAHREPYPSRIDFNKPRNNWFRTFLIGGNFLLLLGVLYLMLMNKYKSSTQVVESAPVVQNYSCVTQDQLANIILDTVTVFASDEQQISGALIKAQSDLSSCQSNLSTYKQKADDNEQLYIQAIQSAKKCNICF
mmetsp:Transcript_15967/g.23693  ORF Transcript_15967/g.23693 Transcript_15967/m.23693 type:complete len:170 (-) Transcript_15967:94-603(-)